MTEPSPIRVAIATQGTSAVVTPTGEIGTHEAPALRQAIKDAYDRKPKRVVVDMSGISYMATAGLATLVEALQTSRRTGVELAICGLQDRVRAVFEISRLTAVFRIVTDLPQALA